MKKIIILLACAVFAGHLAHGEMRKESYALSEAVQYALGNNPRLAALHKDIEIENYTIDEAKGAGRYL